MESATRYVDCMGGVDEVVSKARRYADSGDLRFAAQLLKHAVFADENHTEAKTLLGDVYERLGFGAENGTWRNFYLQGAAELGSGDTGRAVALASPDLVAALTVDQLFDTVAIRINGPACWHEAFAIDWVFTDLGQTYRTELSNGVLIQQINPRAGTADLTATLTKLQLMAVLGGAGLASLKIEGDTSILSRLVSFLDQPTPNFAIVTP